MTGQTITLVCIIVAVVLALPPLLLRDLARAEARRNLRFILARIEREAERLIRDAQRIELWPPDPDPWAANLRAFRDELRYGLMTPRPGDAVIIKDVL